MGTFVYHIWEVYHPLCEDMLKISKFWIFEKNHDHWEKKVIFLHHFYGRLCQKLRESWNEQQNPLKMLDTRLE